MENLERYDSYKDSGIEWLGEIPSNWATLPLKYIFDERKEKNSRRQTTNILSVMKDIGVIPYSEKGDVGNKCSDRIEEYKVVHPNDIVMNSMNVIIGSVGKSDYYGALSQVYHVLKIKDNQFIDYYKYVFGDKSFQKSLIGIGNGILDHRMRIAMGDLRPLHLQVPPIEEQQKIAKYLDTKISAIDQLIDKKSSLIENLKKAKQALITETVTKGLDKTVPMKDSGVEWIGEIPEHWGVSKFKHEVQIDPKKSEVAKLPKNTEVSFTPMEKLRHGTLDGSNTKLLGDVYNGYTYIKDGDIAMAKVTPCYENYNIAIANELKHGIAFGSSEILVLRSKGNIDRKMVYYYMQHCKLRGLMISTMTGAAGLKRISNKVLMDIPIFIQDELEQIQIVEYLDKKVSAFDKLIQLQEQSIEKLKLTKQKLITEVVTGKIKVIDL